VKGNAKDPLSGETYVTRITLGLHGSPFVTGNDKKHFDFDRIATTPQAHRFQSVV
jgi:hypothetical protein